MGTTLFHLVAGGYSHGSCLTFLAKCQKLLKSRDSNWSAQPIFFRTDKAVCRLDIHLRVEARYSPILILTTAVDFVILSTGVMDHLNFFDDIPDLIETVHDHQVKRSSSGSAGRDFIPIL